MAIDLFLLDGDLTDNPRLTNPAEGLRQNVDLALRIWRGEWILDEDHGTPYLEEVLHRRGYMQVARSAIVDRVMSCDGVLSVDSIDLKIENRALRADIVARTTWGVMRFAY